MHNDHLKVTTKNNSQSCLNLLNDLSFVVTFFFEARAWYVARAFVLYIKKIRKSD